MGFVKIGEMLPKIAERTGDPEAMEAAYVLETVNSKIGDIFGEKAIGCVRAVKFKDGVLTIGVVSSVWGQEIKMRERSIKNQLQKMVKAPILWKLRFETT